MAESLTSTPEVRKLLHRAAGLDQPGGDERLKRIVHRVATDMCRIVEEFDVRTPGVDVLAAALSGGNQQKLVVGRELSGDPVLLIAAHPTRGVDVGAQAGIWDELRRARARGLAVLLISADLDELIGLSDTIKVMLRGRLVADADPATVTPEQLGASMTGADDSPVVAPRTVSDERPGEGTA